MSVTIFLSCVSDEFRIWRDRLGDALAGPDVNVTMQEVIKDQGAATVANDETYIRASDLVVHIVGDMTGAMAQPASTEALLAQHPDIVDRLPPLRDLIERGEAISYTQWEAWLALYHGKPLLIVQPDDGAPRGPAFGPTEASRGAQRAHLDRLRTLDRHPVHRTFADWDDLAVYISTAVLPGLLAKKRSGGDGLPVANLVAGSILVFLVPLVTALLTDAWKDTFGLAVAFVLAFVLTVSSVTFALLYARYFGLLSSSDDPPGSRGRRGYDALREGLATGGRAAALYARWLTAFLNRVDCFFGDVRMADRTLSPRFLRLRTPAPLWTAPAFERCLLLALLYPAAMVLIMWAASGHVGRAESVLLLRDEISGWERGVAVMLLSAGAFGFSALGFWRADRISGLSAFAWSAVACCLVYAGCAIAHENHGANIFFTPSGWRLAFLFSGALAGTFVAAFGYAGAVAGIAVGAGAYGIVYTWAIRRQNEAIFHNYFDRHPDLDFRQLNFHNLPLLYDPALVGPGIVAVAVAVVAALAVHRLRQAAIGNGRHGLFLVLFVVVMMSGCMLAGYALWPSRLLRNSLPLLLFFGLLPLLNAPFDWASLGLTRGFLRRGIELRGWWPFLLAVADAVAAAVIIVLLALTMVLGVQTFNDLAVSGGGPMERPIGNNIVEIKLSGGRPVLPLTPLFDGIAAHPEAPEYWWVYALLLSTMIPSLINLIIGGTALMRAVPGLSSRLLHFMPVTGGVPAYERAWIAAVLTGQAALGAFLGIAVQALIAWGLILHVMPFFGFGLLDLARGLAALDLPARVIALFGGYTG